MVKIRFSIAASVLLAVVARGGSAAPTRVVVLEHAKLRLTPAALVFNETGELYVAYRDKGADKKSSAIWVRVFDPVSGKELRSAQLPTTTVALPNGADQLLLSPDNSLLVYSQFHGSTLITITSATTLQKVNDITSLPEGVNRQFPRMINISPNDDSILIAAEVPNPLNGADARLIKLDVHAPSRVLSDTTFANPIPESGYAVDGSGVVWIVRANALYRYDPGRRKASLQTSVHNQDDFRSVLFLNEHSLLMWSNQNKFGYLYRFEEGDTATNKSQRIDKCGVRQIAVSPDQRYGAAVCEHQNTGEWRFGAITARSAVIFDTKTLKILTKVPIEKELYPEVAIWHASGKIVLVTEADSNKLAIYEFPAPGESAAVDPNDGTLHRRSTATTSQKRGRGRSTG
jgi:hypothetical protein